MFLCFLPHVPLHAKLHQIKGDFFSHLQSTSSKKRESRAPPPDPTRTPIQTWIRKREAGAVQPGSRSQSRPEASRLGNGNSMQCSWGRYPSMRVKREKPTLTQIWYPTPELQTQEGESREWKNTNNPTRSHSDGSPASGRKARPFRLRLPGKVEWRPC